MLSRACLNRVSGCSGIDFLVPEMELLGSREWTHTGETDPIDGVPV